MYEEATGFESIMFAKRVGKNRCQRVGGQKALVKLKQLFAAIFSINTQTYTQPNALSLNITFHVFNS